MAAVIRLKRMGTLKKPFHRIVVIDKRRARDSKPIEVLGFYDPKTEPATFQIDNESALKWLLDGAKPTKMARDLLSRAGVMVAWDAAKRAGATAEKAEAAPVAEKAEVAAEPEKAPRAKKSKAAAEG